MHYEVEEGKTLVIDGPANVVSDGIRLRRPRQRARKGRKDHEGKAMTSRKRPGRPAAKPAPRKLC